MLIDLICLLLLLLALWKGLRNGLILAVFSFLAFVIGLAAALKLSVWVAGLLGESLSVPERWLPVIAFIAVFLLVVLLVRLGARLLQGAVEAAALGWLNRLTGVLLYFLLYLFIYSVLLFYAARLQVIRPEAAAASLTYPWLHPLGPRIIDGLGALLPFFSNMFTELLNFFDGTAPNKVS